jgi:hypothetical protein
MTAMLVVIMTTPMPVSTSCQIICMTLQARSGDGAERPAAWLLVQPTQYPHEQQDRDGDAEQP